MLAAVEPAVVELVAVEPVAVEPAAAALVADFAVVAAVDLKQVQRMSRLSFYFCSEQGSLQSTKVVCLRLPVLIH